MPPLDALDRRLLDVLQRDARRSFAELAHEVGSSPASCQRRVARMREAGVIRGEVALVDPEALGPSLTVVVTVELERERLDLVDGFKRAMRDHPLVTHCYMVTGEADFVLIVIVPDVAGFDAFVKSTLYANPNVRKFRSMIALDRIKAEPRLPV